MSRPCYDKPHRCPGWAGGGWKSSKVNHCQSGSIRTHDMRLEQEDGRPVLVGGYPGEHRWRFGRCYKCDVVTWPYNIRWIDPTHWANEVQHVWQRAKWRWEDRRLDRPRGNR